MIESKGKNIFSERLAEEIEVRGYTREKFAKACDISVGMLRYWLKGKSVPTISSFSRVLDVLDISADYMLGLRKDEGKGQNGLKPCPFCGAPAEFKRISDRWSVICSRHCIGTVIKTDKKEVIEIWNRRSGK